MPLIYSQVQASAVAMQSMLFGFHQELDLLYGKSVNQASHEILGMLLMRLKG